MQMNQVLFTGRLGKDPFYTEVNGDFLAYLNIAENMSNGGVVWHKFIILDDTAKKIAQEQELKKGDLVLLKGHLTSDSFEEASLKNSSNFYINSVFKLQGSRKSLDSRGGL